MQIIASGFAKTNPTSSATNLKQHMELKYHTSLGIQRKVNDDHRKSLPKCTTTTQQRWLSEVISAIL